MASLCITYTLIFRSSCLQRVRHASDHEQNNQRCKPNTQTQHPKPHDLNAYPAPHARADNPGVPPSGANYPAGHMPKATAQYPHPPAALMQDMRPGTNLPVNSDRDAGPAKVYFGNAELAPHASPLTNALAAGRATGMSFASPLSHALGLLHSLDMSREEGNDAGGT